MQKKILNYRVIVEKEYYPNGKAVYNVYCPKLDIADYGDTVEKALSSIQIAIELRLEALAEEREEVPQESNEVIFAEVSIVPSKSVIAAL